jgi:hypothetical protein
MSSGGLMCSAGTCLCLLLGRSSLIAEAVLFMAWKPSQHLKMEDCFNLNRPKWQPRLAITWDGGDGAGSRGQDVIEMN